MSYTYQVTVDAGDAYIDQHPTAEGYTVYSSGTVDTETPGNYVITYTFIKLKPAFDTYTENKLVTVSNSTPVITLLGEANKYINIDSIYADAGATTNLGTLETVFPAGGIDTTHDGSYSIMYVARHKGFTSFATRSVHVVGTSNVVLAPTSGLDINDISNLAPAIGIDINDAGVIAPATGLDINDASVLVPAVGIDIDDASVLPLPASGLDITDAYIAKPEAGIDIVDASVLPVPANGLDIQDAGLAPPLQGPYGMYGEVIVYPPAAGLDIGSAVRFIEADTLTMTGEWIQPAYSSYDSNMSRSVTPGGYERAGVVRAGSAKIPTKFSELLFGYPENSYVGSVTFMTSGSTNNYTWNLDEAALQDGIVQYTRKAPQNFPNDDNWSLFPRQDLTSQIQHDPVLELDYFDGLFARYYLDGFWYSDYSVMGEEKTAGFDVDFYSRVTEKDEQPGGNWSSNLSIFEPSAYSDPDIKYAVLAAGGTNHVSITNNSSYITPPTDYANGYSPRNTSRLTPASNGLELSSMSIGQGSNVWPNIIMEIVNDVALVQDDQAALGWPFINSTDSHSEATYKFNFFCQWQFESYNPGTGIVLYKRSAIPQTIQVNNPEYAELKYSSLYNTVVFEGMQVHTITGWNPGSIVDYMDPLGPSDDTFSGYIPTYYNYGDSLKSSYNLPSKFEYSQLTAGYFTDEITYINGAKGFLITRDTDLVNSQ